MWDIASTFTCRTRSSCAHPGLSSHCFLSGPHSSPYSPTHFKEAQSNVGHRIVPHLACLVGSASFCWSALDICGVRVEGCFPQLDGELQGPPGSSPSSWSSILVSMLRDLPTVTHLSLVDSFHKGAEAGDGCVLAPCGIVLRLGSFPAFFTAFLCMPLSVTFFVTALRPLPITCPVQNITSPSSLFPLIQYPLT